VITVAYSSTDGRRRRASLIAEARNDAVPSRRIWRAVTTLGHSARITPAVSAAAAAAAALSQHDDRASKQQV